MANNDRRVRILTDEEKKNIEQLYLVENNGIAVTSKALKISIPVCKKYLTSIGKLRTREEMVALRAKHNEREFEDIEIQTMVEMFNEGVTVYAIKKHFEVSTIPVVRALIKGGIDKSVFAKHWTMGPIRELLKSFED